MGTVVKWGVLISFLKDAAQNSLTEKLRIFTMKSSLPICWYWQVSHFLMPYKPNKAYLSEYLQLLVRVIILNVHLCAELNYRTAFKEMQRYEELIASKSAALPISLLFFSISIFLNICCKWKNKGAC